MLVDSHCHLDFPELANDLSGVLARAAAAGVGVMQTICTRISTFEPVRRIALEHPGIYCSVGIHPHHVDEEADASPERITQLARGSEVIGIGETGLDYFYDRGDRDRQRHSFRAHIRAARECALPVIVHSRDADRDTMDILEDEARAGGVRGVIHCFTGSQELADRALALGFYISVSGIVTFRNAQPLREIVRAIPLDRLLVETDAPYLAPVPQRGKRNEPAFVAYTAAFLAELLRVDVTVLGAATADNFFALFQKARRPTPVTSS